MAPSSLISSCVMARENFMRRQQKTLLSSFGDVHAGQFQTIQMSIVGYFREVTPKDHRGTEIVHLLNRKRTKRTVLPYDHKGKKRVSFSPHEGSKCKAD